jgi:predicted secreted Zn-dependent protease
MVPVKKILLLLMFISAAHHAFAADNRIAVASLDKAEYRRDHVRAQAPVVKEMYEYYEVKGSSEGQLRNELCRNGCQWKDGKTYDSVTNWHVKWDYDYDRAPETCSADSFKVFVDITFRYPKWVRTDGVLQALVDKWDSYVKSLVEHESGHRDMAVAAAADLSRAVTAMPPAPTCAELDRRVRVLCHERMKRLEDEAKAYDADTHHGSTQGAVFP